MGLSDLVSRATAARAHVLVVEAPGAFAARVALERAVDAAGWCRTDTVADADVLAVVGEPGPELRAVVQHVWGQLSEPRARVQVRAAADAAPALTAARRALRATDEQRARGRERRDSRGREAQEQDAMSPDGIALAEGAEDRDGLEMDELHLPLGPVLAHWPAGVVLRLTLHGDVVAAAEVERLDGPVAPAAAGPAAAAVPPVGELGGLRAARLLDAAASVLHLVGLPVEAHRARRLRDGCLEPDPVAAREVRSLARRVSRHRILRWLVRDHTGPILDGRPADLHDRLVDVLVRAGQALDPQAEPSLGPGLRLDGVPALVLGRELAEVRLWLALVGADLEVPRTESSRA